MEEVMAYWWVYQTVYETERKHGYICVPCESLINIIPDSWVRIKEVKPGDVIFSVVDQSLVSVSIAKTKATENPPPFKTRQVNVSYRLFPKAPQLNSDILNKLQDLLDKKESPLTSDSNKNAGYLFAISSHAAQALFEWIELKLKTESEIGARSIDDLISNLVEGSDSAERCALQSSRIGQGKFRSELLEKWNSQCCVTSLNVTSLLRASHIKPWRDCNNQERLDHYNGFLLSPTYDAAFDAGFISFENDGKIKLSNGLSYLQTQALGLSPTASIQDSLSTQHKKYLKYHRDYIFQA
jgi:hypothetical protein